VRTLVEKIFLQNLDQVTLTIPECQDEQLSMEQQMTRDSLTAQMNAAKEAGFTKVAAAIESELLRPSREKKAKTMLEAKKKVIEEIGAKLLTRNERWLWEGWLPTSYLIEARHNSFESYVFDRPTLSILELVYKVKNLGVFDSLSIRTPEKGKSDPVLFGHFDGNTYLLARWGESDAYMIDMNQIKTGLKARFWNEVMNGFGGWILALSILIGLLCILGGFSTNGHLVPKIVLIKFFGKGAVIGTVFLLVALAIRRRCWYAFR